MEVRMSAVFVFFSPDGNNKLLYRIDLNLKKKHDYYIFRA